MLKRLALLPAICAILLLICSPLAAGWLQFGQNPQHSGNPSIIAQPPLHILADVNYDSLVDQELSDSGGELFLHYQAALVDGNDVFMEFKSGSYTGRPSWETQSWSIHKLSWQGGKLTDRWAGPSDWKPEPFGSPVFEPVFHAALTTSYLYEPGAGGTLLQIDRNDGHLVRRINPFGTAVNPTIFVAGPLTSDAAGDIYYNALQLSASGAWNLDAPGSWLVRVKADGSFKTAPFSALVPDAPLAQAQCTNIFASTQLPWPPSPGATAPSITCGSQRPGINVAPAIAPDGTIYTVSRAHLNSRWGYLVAVNPDLTPKWARSLRNRFHDGCNVLLPANGAPGGCRAGATTGVDPSDNQPGSGSVNDNSTASPVVAPDGSVIYGAYTRYNYSQGHTMKFGADGTFLASYQFGWDTTPAVWAHDGTFSLVTKENHYDSLSYCGQIEFCSSVRPSGDQEAYYITQLDSNLRPEWKFRSSNTLGCARNWDGTTTCTDDHPDGFEWCVNAPAIDARGTVYVNSEDGRLYAIAQGGYLAGSILLQFALGAAYTPISIGGDGAIFAQNAGHLFVVGGEPTRRRGVKK